MNNPNGYCPQCGAAHTDADHPRTCPGCGAVTYANPTPVAVALIPVGPGLLCVRRGTAPHIGKLALPAGFHVMGEDFRQGAVREVWEETGIRFHPEDARVVAPEHGDGPDWDPLFSTPNGNLLYFVELPAIMPRDIRLSGPELVEHSLGETQELVIVDDFVDLAFPAHTRALHLFLRRDPDCREPWDNWGHLDVPGLDGRPRREVESVARARLGMRAGARIAVSRGEDGRSEVFVRRQT